MELEESTCLTSGSTTTPQSSRQYGTGTTREIWINGTKQKQNHNRFNKDFKNGSHEKIFFYISVFVPVPYCLDDCGVVVEPEVRQVDSSSSILLSQDYFG